MKWIVRKWARNSAARIPLPTRRVAIMVPLSTPRLNKDEEVSMRQLRTHLDHYEKFLLVPKGSGIRMDGFTVIEISRGFFGSAANHNRLLFSIGFWQQFAQFEYVLMYHLDAIVLSDQLLNWCDRGFDFIGAPYIHSAESTWVVNDRVGNGGFAIYRVASILKVLWNRYAQEPSVFYADYFWPLIECQRRLLQPIRAAVPGWLRGRLTDPLRKPFQKLDYIEASEFTNDLFWADEARHYLPEFKVAPLEAGLRFAFEAFPRQCLERNGGNMPFGGHAWGRYDRAFWEELLHPDRASSPADKKKSSN